jgi:hypothetical protein
MNISLRKYWSRLKIFGLTPYKLWHRMVDRNLPKVFCNSLPKSGTNLVQRALFLSSPLYRKMIPTVNGQNVDRWGFNKLIDSLRSGQVLVAHLPYSSRRESVVNKKGVKSIFMVRDIRDIILSRTKYISRNEDHEFNNYYKKLHNERQKVQLTIFGDEDKGIIPMRSRLEQFLGWLDTEALVLRFEDLLGPKGGGSTERQLSTLQKMYDKLGINYNNKMLKKISDNLFFTGSPTFRKGLIGQWKDKMNNEEIKTVRKEMGDLISKYGY